MDPDRWATIRSKNIDLMLAFLAGCEPEDLPSADLKAGARQYLKDAGMTGSQIDSLLKKATGR